MAKGFLYLVVIMDWVSRAVLAWRLGAEFCVEALEEALARHGRPELSCLSIEYHHPEIA
jgi:putative transposase